MRVPSMSSFCFITQLTFIFFNDTATTEIYTLSLHDALPIFERADEILVGGAMCFPFFKAQGHSVGASLCEEEGVEPARRALFAAGEKLQLPGDLVAARDLAPDADVLLLEEVDVPDGWMGLDRKSVV